MAKIVFTEQAPNPIGPYSQAIIANGFLFVLGQIALQTNGEMADNDLGEETHQVMKNIGAVLEAAGCNYSSIVKTTIFLVDMNDFAVVNKIYGSYYSGRFPARETVEVSALPKNARVEISVVAEVP